MPGLTQNLGSTSSIIVGNKETERNMDFPTRFIRYISGIVPNKRGTLFINITPPPPVSGVAFPPFPYKAWRLVFGGRGFENPPTLEY